MSRSRVRGAGEASSEATRAAWTPASGRPLRERERGFYEDKLGVDLGAVRIHDDATADAMARALDAVAYTSGDHVVARSGALGTVPEHDPLLAHELVHVAQQRLPAPSTHAPMGAEREADAGARDVQSHHRVVPSTAAPHPIQRYAPTSLTEVALEDAITGVLGRRVREGDWAAARRRADDVEALFARLGAHDSMVLHGRLLAETDELGRLFHHQLSTPTRRRLLRQLLRQSLRAGEEPVTEPDEERAFYDGISIDVPDYPVLVDPLEHESESVLVTIQTAAPMPPDLELTAEWVVECLDPTGDAHEVIDFANLWPPGMGLLYTYDVNWVDRGVHVYTLRLRDAAGDIVHIARGRYLVTSEIPQTIEELRGHPQYIDSFGAANYDVDFQPPQPGWLSYTAGLEFADGMTFVELHDVNETGTEAQDFHWHEGRIVPGEMNPTTTPDLVQVRHEVDLWIDEYNTMFIIQAFMGGVMPILDLTMIRVGPMPSGPAPVFASRVRPRTPVPPPPVPDPAGGGGGGLSGGAMRTRVDAGTTIVDADIAIALDKASQGIARQPGLETEAVAALGGTSVAATPTAVRQVVAGQGGVAVTVPMTSTGGTAAERAAVTADLAAARVGGGAAGAEDRAMITEAMFAAAEPGVTPVLATGDRGVINRLASMPGTGINVQRLGRYQNVAEYLYYTQGGARTFSVTVGGRPLIIRPIQVVRPGL